MTVLVCPRKAYLHEGHLKSLQPYNLSKFQRNLTSSLGAMDVLSFDTKTGGIVSPPIPRPERGPMLLVL